jgi:hypothetical protein
MNQNAADTVYRKKENWNKALARRMQIRCCHHSYGKNNMREALKVSASLGQEKVGRQTDQELAQSYFELQKLRQQLRVAECRRAMPNPAPHGFVPKNLH